MNTSKISFQGPISPFVQTCFLTALGAFPALEQHPIQLRMLPLGKTTMQAQPMLNWNLWNLQRRGYYVDINSQISLALPLRPDELPEKVLVGWFAHELGHVMDYRQRGLFNLIFLGLGYILSSRIRKQVEQQADLQALAAGMGEEVLATKRFLLNHRDLPETYKRRLGRYYLSEEKFALLLHEQGERNSAILPKED